jgi:hypothetical protein
VKLIKIEKDKQNRPVAQVDISPWEISAIKKAVRDHPKFKDPEPEGMRFRALAEKEDWSKLTNINIKDMKEAVNKAMQDTNEPKSTIYDSLHEIWKELNPS